MSVTCVHLTQDSNSSSELSLPPDVLCLLGYRCSNVQLQVKAVHVLKIIVGSAIFPSWHRQSLKKKKKKSFDLLALF